MMETKAVGPSTLAGAGCNPNFFSTSYQNDQVHEILGKVAQDRGYGWRKHLIDQEGRHASSDSRCRAIVWLRSAIPRLRPIRSRTSSACSAA